MGLPIMMHRAKILTAIDIGTTKVCTVIGERSEMGSLSVLGHSVVPCEGLVKGVIENLVATQISVRASVKEAEAKAGVKIGSAYVGITGSHVSFENRSDVLSWVGRHGVITSADLTQVPDNVAEYSKGIGRKVLHAIPISYSLDGQPGIKDPLGMHTRRLEVKTHVVTGAAAPMEQLVKAVEGTGIRVEGLVLESLASSEAVLTPMEKAGGCVLIDIGGGTTEVIAYRAGSMYYTSAIPVGGFQFTNDICLTYNTPYDCAEEAKLNFASTEPDSVRPHEEFTLEIVGRSTTLTLPRRDLCQLTRERAQELARLIALKLRDAEIADLSEVNLILTGGAAKLAGFEAMLKKILTPRVRIGSPMPLPGMLEELRQPDFATSVGILIWAAEQKSKEATNGTNGNGASHSEREPVGSGSGVSRILNPFKWGSR